MYDHSDRSKERLLKLLIKLGLKTPISSMQRINMKKILRSFSPRHIEDYEDEDG